MELHQSTIFDIQTQTLELIESSKSLIKKIEKNNNIDKQEGGLLAKDVLEETLSTLENEYQKAEDLEVVIAVVGTMKAGKSTTINAIVGQEILPNRNYPMTSLPTVVTHVNGQKVPVLLFKNNSPIAELAKTIAKKIGELSHDATNRLDFFHNKHVESLVSELIEHGAINLKERYEGQKEIFEFLKKLNDLMRLAKELSIEPPYDSYKLIDSLPVIEVEFQHLSGIKHPGKGKLSIMDTPGPNEFGQSEKLTAIFKEQLSKASAVLLIADYTQMNSEAGGKVRNEVSSVLGSLDGRFFVMLNKFDAMGKNDTSREDTVSFFCDKLMDEEVKAENVFPVSAHRAFLANRVLSEIGETKTIDISQDWVEDFGVIAFGEDWQEDIEDLDDVVKKANKIWKKAGFDAPLKKVILEANNKAAIFSLNSALTKLKEKNKLLCKGIGGFKDAIGSKIEELQSAIDNIEKDRKAVDGIQKKTEKLVEKHSADLESLIENLKETVERKVAKEVSDLFNAEKSRLKKREENEKNEQQRTIHQFFNTFNIFSSHKKSEDLNSLLKNGELKFNANQKDEAEAVLKAINEALKHLLDRFIKEAIGQLNCRIEESEDEINSTIQHELKEVIDKANEQLQVNGFSLTLSIENFNSFRHDVKTHSISTRASVSKEEVRGSRVTNRFFNFFNDDWGRESYTYEKDVYIINVESIKKMANSAVKNTMLGLQQVSSDFLRKQVRPSIKKHLTETSGFLEKYRQTLLAGKSAKQKSHEEKEVLILELGHYETEVERIIEDTSDSEAELKVAGEGTY